MELQPTPPTIQVAAGIIWHQGRILISQRPPEVHLSGLWEFPGGKLHPPESFEEALHRELLEELGIQVSIHSLAFEVSHPYPEKTVHLQFFHCHWLSGIPRPLQCQDLQWVSPSDLHRFSFPAADAQLIQRLSQTPPLHSSSPLS